MHLGLLQGSNVADEAKLICIIRDMTNPLTTTKFTITLSVSTKASTLVEEVARQLGYVVNTFNLVYDKQQEEGPDEEVRAKVNTYPPKSMHHVTL